MLEKKKNLLKGKVWSGRFYQTKVNVVKPKIECDSVSLFFFQVCICIALELNKNLYQIKKEISHMRILLGTPRNSVKEFGKWV